MNIYFAPLEGITVYPFRNAHRALFDGVDRYYMPFIATHSTRTLKTKEKKDVLPLNNPGGDAVPQLLSNEPEDFLWYADALCAQGYREINLNLGCPSGTVVTKRKGAGFLYDPDALDAFFERIFEGMETLCPDCRLTVKTRIGIEDASEAEALLQVYNRYPIAELTVHPRLQKQFYRGTPDQEAFRRFYDECRLPLCYNGDIISAAEYRALTERFPRLGSVMLGRGLIADPALAREVRGGAPLTLEEMQRFHDLVFANWMEDQGDFNNVLYRMKELWGYFAQSFDDGEKYLKKIKKSRKEKEYLLAVEQFWAGAVLRAR